MPTDVHQTRDLLLFVINVAVIIGGLWKGIAVLVSVRDSLRDLTVNVGTRDPPTGLLGSMAKTDGLLHHHDRRLVRVETKLNLEDQ